MACVRAVPTRWACASSTSAWCCRPSACTVRCRQRLEADALVVKRAPVRGKIGQPSVPMALNPEGAYSIGIKIGRRSLDVLLVDFTEQVRERLTLAYEFPDPDTLFDEIRARLKTQRHRVLHA